MHEFKYSRNNNQKLKKSKKYYDGYDYNLIAKEI